VLYFIDWLYVQNIKTLDVLAIWKEIEFKVTFRIDIRRQLG